MAGVGDAKAGVRELFDLVAPAYDRSGVAYFEPIGRRLVGVAGVRAGDRVLDVGCGRGAVTFAAAEAVGPGGHVTAIDLAPEMVSSLAREVEARGLANVEVRVGDAEEPRVPVASFDRVLASLVLFFVPDLSRALGAARDALVPGGTLGFTTLGPDDPRWAPLEALLREASGVEHRHDEEDDPLGTADAIGRTLAAAGFVDVEVHDETLRVHFTSPSQWLAWYRGTSGRAMLDTIPVERRDRSLGDAQALVDTFRGGDGRIDWDVVVRFTTARRPPGAVRPVS